MKLIAIALIVGCGGSADVPAEPERVDSALDTDAADSAVVVDTADAVIAMPETRAPDAPSDAPLPCGCGAYTDPLSAGTIASAALREISGLAVSVASPGVLWTHNDSGDSARLFALDTKGALLGELRVTGATAIDWEDMAVGPCAGGTCLYVADFGDNATNRTNDALYRIAEPAIAAKPFTTFSVAAEKFPFEYPDGQWNAEALLVHPRTGEIVIVTKGASPGVYRFPSPLTTTKMTLVRVGAPSGLDGVVTGGSVSPCGDRALLRTYASLFEYRFSGSLAAAFSTMPTKVPVGKEPQGEAVAYRAGGAGYFTASEGASVPLLATACR